MTEDSNREEIDIVEELRWQKRYAYGRVPLTMERAAKEIERLRNELRLSQQITNPASE